MTRRSLQEAERGRRLQPEFSAILEKPEFLSMDKVQRAFDLVSSLSEEEMSELLKRTPTLKKKNKAPREG
jgi:hypothetical protein